MGAAAAIWQRRATLAGSGAGIMVRAVTGEGIVMEHSAMRQNAYNALKSVTRSDFLVNASRCEVRVHKE